jgi:hypothetical protein
VFNIRRWGTTSHRLTHVKHAGEDSLNRLEPLLSELRMVQGLVERKRGSFYRKSAAFLHFHEDPAGLYADVRLGTEFDRYRVESDSERSRLVAMIRSL